MFLERIINMRGEYESRMDGMSRGWLLSTIDKWFL
jgi:hypothetical protein